MNEVERTARAIAAEKMGLVKHPHGLNLPDDLWRQAIPHALRELEAQRGPEERPSMDQVAKS